MSIKGTPEERRAVLVTGGAGGIGAEIGRQLAADGYRVAIADLHLDRSQAVASALPGSGHVAVKMDVSKASDVGQGMAVAEQALGPLHVLVHAAGALLTQEDGSLARFWESGIERWDRVMAINARGSFLVAAEFVKRRVAAPVVHGRVVLFSSITGQNGGSRPYADYAASKAAVLGFLRAAAKECAPLDITVNAIAPGQIDTPMLRQSGAAGMQADPNLIPMARFGSPADIAACVRYIVSPEASFVTGATFDVNGGQRMQ